jgi:hypothetical protein
MAYIIAIPSRETNGMFIDKCNNFCCLIQAFFR